MQPCWSPAGATTRSGPAARSYVCGYMNRYRNTIRFLMEEGCEVLVVTPGKVRPSLLYFLPILCFAELPRKLAN